jgi:bacteriocin biosynthesis cyclodehydratase domain-containing protein
VLLVSPGPLPRDVLDPFVRDGRAHVVVAPAGGGLTVGPFVAPGLTACLRCVDAHLAEHDPRRAVVLEQCGRQPPAPVEPRDPTLLALALAWAVRDVIRFVDGVEPATWSATVSIGADAMPVRRSWHRHPHCGCSWGDALVG